MGKGNFLPIIAAALLIILATGFILFKSGFVGFKPPTPSPTPTATIDYTDGDIQILTLLPQWVPQATWEDITRDEIERDGQKLPGFLRSGTLETHEVIGRFGDEATLKQHGWVAGKFEASGPGGEVWEYIKEGNGKQVLQFFYQNRSLTPNPNGGVTTQCPCTFELQVFLTDPF